MTELQEMRLRGRAVKERWDIPKTEKQATVERACFLRDHAEKESTQVAAIKTLLQMEAQNQADEQHDDRMDEGRNRVLDLIARSRAEDGNRIAERDREEHARAGIVDQIETQE